MPSEATLDREALRIALGFVLAFVLAEGLELQLTFLAPLVAGALLAGPLLRPAQLLVLPVLAAGSVAAAGFVTQLLHTLPAVLCLLLWCVYRSGLSLSAHPRSAAAGLIVLLVFAILPVVIIHAPELGSDVTRWFAGNFLIAAISAGTIQAAMGSPRSKAPDQPLEHTLTASGGATALLCAVILAVALDPPAVGAALVSVVITLRPDAIPPRLVVRNRLLAAVIGGGASLIAWQATWLQPSLAVLASSTLVLAFLIARRIVAQDSGSGVAMKSLNAFAILIGEGFSIFYEDTDERLWVRLAGVLIGVAYVAVVILLAGPARAPKSAHERDRMAA
jgi:hypothetical protein